jgi:hypothetical protein
MLKRMSYRRQKRWWNAYMLFYCRADLDTPPDSITTGVQVGISIVALPNIQNPEVTEVVQYLVLLRQCLFLMLNDDLSL